MNNITNETTVLLEYPSRNGQGTLTYRATIAQLGLNANRFAGPTTADIRAEIITHTRNGDVARMEDAMARLKAQSERANQESALFVAARAAIVEQARASGEGWPVIDPTTLSNMFNTNTNTMEFKVQASAGF